MFVCSMGSPNTACPSAPQTPAVTEQGGGRQRRTPSAGVRAAPTAGPTATAPDPTAPPSIARGPLRIRGVPRMRGLTAWEAAGSNSGGRGAGPRGRCRGRRTRRWCTAAASGRRRRWSRCLRHQRPTTATVRSVIACAVQCRLMLIAPSCGGSNVHVSASGSESRVADDVWTPQPRSIQPNDCSLCNIVSYL